MADRDKHPGDVAVTGLGLVTSAGMGIEANWERVLATEPTASTDPALGGTTTMGREQRNLQTHGVSEVSANPAAASRPFDTDRDGFVAAEDAGVLELERMADARARAATIRARISNSFGFDWHPIDQGMIDGFAALSGDHQWIHQIGPRADQGPYAGPIAQGFLTLSLLIPMIEEVFQVEGVDLTLNKGLDRLRFTSPVPVGAQVRATVRLTSVRPRPCGYSEITVHVTVEIKGHTRPAFTADSVVLYRTSSATGS